MPHAFSLLVLFLIATPAFAQPADSTASPLRAGARALTFQPVLIGLNAFDGGSLSYKRHSSARRAVRVGLTVAGSAQAETNRTNDVTLESQTLYLAATVLPVRHTASRTRMAPYLGLGPEVSIQIQNQEVEDARIPNPDGFSQIGLGLGAVGVIGVEWPVSDAISLSGEYGQALTALFTLGDQEGYRVRFAPQGPRLGASVYF